MGLIRKLRDNPIMKTKQVRRFSGVHLIEPETLSDYATNASLLALHIWYDLDEKVPNHGIDKGTLLELCLIHNINEVFTNDMRKSVKESIPGLKSMLRESSYSMLSQCDIFDGVISGLWYHQSSMDPTAYEVIKCIKLIMASYKLYNEYVLKGNKEVEELIGDCKHYLDDLISYYNKWNEQPEGDLSISQRKFAETLTSYLAEAKSILVTLR